jgi:hypothetical protein
MKETEQISSTKKVFISYCWSSKEHEDWVHSLAERLVSNGVDVKYDKWDLKEGQDKFAFMESMIQDGSIEKVLIICDKKYKEKADKRQGGVGTETQIITPELYGKAEQTKFIPIIAEQGESFDSYMPTFLKARIGVDLSTQTIFEEGYEQLLRLIYEKPKYSKPRLGTMPSFLEQGGAPTYKTKNINLSLQNCIFKNPSQCEFYIKDFIDEFKNTLSEFKLEYSDLTEPQDEVVYNKIHEMLPIRNDYISFLDMICKSKQLNIDLIIKLFEELYPFTEPQGNGSFSELQFDHYRFFIMELFLYTCLILIKNEDYSNFKVFINSPYFINHKFGNNENPSNYTSFRFNVDTLESRARRLRLNTVSFTAGLLEERSTLGGVNHKNDLADVDLFLYYLSHLKANDIYSIWFPTTYLNKDRNKKVDILKRLVSKRHFDKVKGLFDVNTQDGLKNLMSNFDEELNKQFRYSNAWYGVPNLKWQIQPDDICSMA